MSLTAFNGYPVSIAVAVLFHGLIIAVLLYFEQAETEVIDIVRPPVVKAILVNENPQQVNAEREEQALRRVEQQRETERREEQQRQEQQRQEQQRQEAEAAERRRVQEQQRQEQQRQEQQRQQEEAAQQATERRQQEERQREEQRRQEQAQREAEQRRQEELAAQQQATAEAQARAEAEARERAETEAELVTAYSYRIHDVIQRQWSRPPSARNGMEVVLRIRLAPTGDVLGNVEIVRSSGDYAFDQAAVNAVARAQPFRQELQGMPPRMFERNFRSLLLTFRPEDLLN